MTNGVAPQSRFGQVRSGRAPLSAHVTKGRIMDQLLTVGQVADLLGTTQRFPRRLITERRIRFVRVGRHVRVPLSAVQEFIDDGTVVPVERRAS